MEKTYDSKRPWKYAFNESITIRLLAYIIWPFGTWLYSLRKANSKASFIIFFLFSLLICWHFSETSGLAYDDFIGIKQRFEQTNISTDQLLNQIEAYFSLKEDAPKELYEIVMIWLTKSIVNNYHLYFLLCAIPVAIFQLLTLRRVVMDYRFDRNSLYAIAIMIMIIFPRDIITVQNPRFATALCLGVYICISSFTKKSNRLFHVIPILLCPLIHSGMWVFTIICVLFTFIPKPISFLEKVALCTIPLGFFTTDFLIGFDFSQYLPSTLSNWAELYNNEESYAILHGEGRAGFWWVSWIFDTTMQIAYAWMAIKIIKGNRKYENEEGNNFYPFFLVLIILCNIMHSLPEIGKRYYWILQIIIMFMWFKSQYPYNNRIIQLLIFGSFRGFLFRYGYLFGGALAVTTPIDIYFLPLPYLMLKGLLF